MLRQLKISNFAIIDNVDIDFGKGLTTITGETGAGKSIMLGAMSLILGGKIDTKAIRNTSAKTVVEATFDVTGYGLEAMLEQNDIDTCGEECLMRREISPTGRSRAFINDTPVTLPVMRGVAMRLIDIHSQHSNLLLSSHSYQLDVIDSLTASRSTLERYRGEYKRYRELTEELARLTELNQRSKRDEDYMRFQLAQLAQLALSPGEDTQLESQERTLSNVNDIKTALWEAQELLDGEERSVVADVASAMQKLRRIEPLLNEAGDLAERLNPTIIELKDIARTIATTQSALADDPAELERIRYRLSEIYALEQKHKATSVDQLIEIQHSLEERLAQIDSYGERIATLQKQVIAQEATTRAVAGQLSGERKDAARRFEQSLIQAAAPLGMSNLRFVVRFETIPLSPGGTDAVSFMTSFNKQQELMPVESTASGGEISRLMLCIKSIIAGSVKLPTIVLDEVDTGVSGEIANRMGEMMKGISGKIQVIAITHLPQVAVKGDNQLKVYKEDSETATVASIKQLTPGERVTEIASMLSGAKIDEAAINNAKSLLGMNVN